MVILYLRAPIAALIGILPRFTGIRVSWGRIKNFNEDIDPLERAYTFGRFFKELDLPEFRVSSTGAGQKVLPGAYHNVENLKIEDVRFKYKNEIAEEQFEVGPINIEANKGEIFFITGGNGSGKTTLMKILAGLYETSGGCIKINGEEVDPSSLSEHCSAIFSDYHLFKKLYEIDIKNKENKINEYIKLLKLEAKVHLEADSFSTIDLSGGQRKRLALIQCFLEDRPVLLFDELAASQDPGFRNFIYRDLFPRLQAEGKIIIACTHDDHYFDTADKIIKMDMGKIEVKFEKDDITARSIADVFMKSSSHIPGE
jgi:ABC-type siderophore export system fused ATPase/permease subunit